MDEQHPSPRAQNHAPAMGDRPSTVEAALIGDNVSATSRFVNSGSTPGVQACHEIMKHLSRMTRDMENPILDCTWGVWNGRLLLPPAHGRHGAGTDPLSTLEPHQCLTR